MSSVVAIKVGIIGGSGLNRVELFSDKQEKKVTTVYGDPSDSLITGNISGVPCVLLARHGRSHTISPTNVNYRANIEAMRVEGCTHILASTACGGLQEDMRPGDLVILDQFIDRTQKREQTFYDGVEGHKSGVLHCPMAEPFCAKTRSLLIDLAAGQQLSVHPRGCVLTIEGPRFSSRAESRLFHSWGADVINMTTVPEVVLAREAGMCYASVAMVTDYDSWKEGNDNVTVDTVLQTFKANASKVRDLFLAAIPRITAADFADELKANQDMIYASILGRD